MSQKNSPKKDDKPRSVKARIEKISGYTEEKLILLKFRTMKILNAATVEMKAYKKALKAWEEENFPGIKKVKSNRKVSGLILAAVSEAMKKYTSSPDKVDDDDILDESGDFSFI
jgi:post-segregation antitoxin (ccd killing protein)